MKIKSIIKLITGVCAISSIAPVALLTSSCSSAGWSNVTNVIFNYNGSPITQQQVLRPNGETYYYSNMTSQISQSTWILSAFAFPITIAPDTSGIDEILYSIRYYEIIGGNETPEGIDSAASFDGSNKTFSIPQVTLDQGKQAVGYQRHETIYIWKSSTVGPDTTNFLSELEIIYMVGA